MSLALSSAPLGWHALQWVGLIPLLWAWEPLGKRASLGAGLLAGAATQVALFTWLAPAFAAYSDAPSAVAWLGFALYVAWESLPFGLLGLVDWALRQRCPRARWWLFACALVGLEWLWPRVFAWRLGAPQVQASYVAPLAALLGPLGLTGLVALVNGGLYERIHSQRVFPPLIALLALGACALGSANWSREDLDPDVSLPRVAWVQPGVVSVRGANAEEVWAALEAGCRRVGQAGGAEVCVLPEGISPEAWMELDEPPEGAVGLRWERDLKARREALTRRFQALATSARAPILIGLTKRRVVPHGADQLKVVSRTNATLLVGSGGVLGWAGKRRLLPFAEELPWEGLRTLIPMAGRYSPAPGTGRLELPGGESAGVLVCYEAIWSRAFAGDAPGILLNPTNDDWFTGQGPALHAMLCRLRSVESGRPLVRVASTGTSYVVSRRGRILAWAPHSAKSGVVSLRAGQGATLYSLLGDGWAILAGLLALAVPLLSSKPRRRSVEEQAAQE